MGGLNTSKRYRDLMEKRREAVSRLRLRGLTIRAIVKALGEGEHAILSESGKPYGRSVIHSDLKALTKEWHKNAASDIAGHQAKQLAVLEEIQREAWKAKKWELVLRTHDRIAKLLGTNAPEKTELSGYVSQLPTGLNNLSPKEKKNLVDLLRLARG